MSNFAQFKQDPAENLDYLLDWTVELAGDTIIGTPTVVATAGLTATYSASLSTSTTTVIWMSGGTAGVSYQVACTVTTLVGRVLKRSVTMNILNL